VLSCANGKASPISLRAPVAFGVKITVYESSGAPKNDKTAARAPSVDLRDAVELIEVAKLKIRKEINWSPVPVAHGVGVSQYGAAEELCVSPNKTFGIC